MSLKPILLVSGLMLILLTVIGCSAATPTGAPTPAPTIVYIVATDVPTRALANPTLTPNVLKFGTVSNSGGSVTIDAQLLDFQIGQPLMFEVVLNTHSVDLSDDMAKISLLRDDAGKEYAPIGWEGAGPGGHHREGKLKFAAMTTKPKYIELVIKNVAKVSERAFRWELK